MDHSLIDETKPKYVDDNAKHDQWKAPGPAIDPRKHIKWIHASYPKAIGKRCLDQSMSLDVVSDTSGAITALLDYVIWNERSATAVEAIAQSQQLKPGEERFELWITGVPSPLFVREAKACRLGVTDHIPTILPLLD